MKLKTIFESLNLKEDSPKLTPGQIKLDNSYLKAAKEKAKTIVVKDVSAVASALQIENGGVHILNVAKLKSGNFSFETSIYSVPDDTTRKFDQRESAYDAALVQKLKKLLTSKNYIVKGISSNYANHSIYINLQKQS